MNKFDSLRVSFSDHELEAAPETLHADFERARLRSAVRMERRLPRSLERSERVLSTFGRASLQLRASVPAGAEYVSDSRRRMARRFFA